jgi:zinc D-Ala-D-Ala carboxypeptidase
MTRPWKNLRWVILGFAVASTLIILQQLYPLYQSQSAQKPHILPASITKIELNPGKDRVSTIAPSTIDKSNSGLSTPFTLQEVQKSGQPPVLSKDVKLPLDKSAKLGHLPYVEAEQKHLMVISSYAQSPYQRYERLNADAALTLMRLIYAARDEGVWIVPVSGFRNTADQEKLFQRQIEKTGSEVAAARISAPPGHSEHHTGYAIDLADGSTPNQDLTKDFEQTKAFRWLTQYAGKFGFEMSFPLNNSQGVSYEPWHWRFVGSSQAQMIFAKAIPAL